MCEFCVIFARNMMPEFCIIIAEQYFPNFGGHVLPLPPPYISYAYGRLLAIHIFVRRNRQT